MIDPSQNKHWQSFLSWLPEDRREVAEDFPPHSKWQHDKDTLYYYTPCGMEGGHLIMEQRDAKTHRIVQIIDGVSPRDLIPWAEGNA
jgi:hypothetical protein